MSYAGSLGKFAKREGRQKDKDIIQKEEAQREMLSKRFSSRKNGNSADVDLMAEQDIEP